MNKEETTFYAGAAEIDITPPVGIKLLGYNRDSPATEVLDPLLATVLLITNKKSQKNQPQLLNL